MATIPQPSLSGGELAPSLHGRVDLALYQTSVKTCLNFVTQAYGGAKNRQGSRFVAECYSSSVRSRLVPFTFNAEQNYILEISGATSADTQGKIRVFSRGKMMLYEKTFTLGTGGSAVTYTKDDPLEVNAPWQEADVRALKFSQTGDVLTVTHQNYQPFQITRQYTDASGVYFSIRDLNTDDGPWQDENTNTSVKVKITGTNAVGDTVDIITTNRGVFANAAVGMLIRVHQEKYGIPWEGGKLVDAGAIRRSDGKYYQAEAAGKTGSLRPTNETGTWVDGGPGGTDGVTGVSWKYLHSGYGTGQLVEIPSYVEGLGQTVKVKVLKPFPSAGGAGAVPAPIFITIEDMAESTGGKILALITEQDLIAGAKVFLNGQIFYYTAGKSYTSITFNNTEGVVVDTRHIEIMYSWAGIAAQGFNGMVAGYDTLDLFGAAPGADPDYSSYRWSIGAWGGPMRWPRCSAYFQQRHCFAGSYGEPQKVWMSKTADYENWGTSSPIADSDSLRFEIASAQIDGIVSMLPMDKLALFTLGGNWIVPGGQDDVLTPGNLNAKIQNYYGSSQLAPVGLGNSVLYYGKSGTVRDMAYDFASDSYVGNDLAVKANHLLRDWWIVEWDFQQHPFPVIWMVREDGALLGLTYLREEKVVGWHRHDLGGVVESVAVINECYEDHIYLVVQRVVNGLTKRYVECLYGWTDDFYEACFSDSSLSYDGRNSVTGAYIKAAGGSYIAGASVSLTASGTGNTPFGNTAAQAYINDQIVLEAADGVRHRITLTAVADSTHATGTLGTALPVGLQNTDTDSWAIAQSGFTGIGHLEGETVSVYSDGAYTTKTVTGGAITLTIPGYVVCVGLPITADLETLPLTVPGQSGPLREVAKLVHTVRVQVEASRSCYIGPDADHLLEATLRDPNDSMTEVTSGDGLIEVNTVATWNKNGQFLIRHTKPYPLSILALYPDIAVGLP